VVGDWLIFIGKTEIERHKEYRKAERGRNTHLVLDVIIFTAAQSLGDAVIYPRRIPLLSTLLNESNLHS
jgi:hypothetical protein